MSNDLATRNPSPPTSSRRHHRWRALLLALLLSLVLFLLGLEEWELWVMLGVGLYLRWVTRIH